MPKYLSWAEYERRVEAIRNSKAPLAVRSRKMTALRDRWLREEAQVQKRNAKLITGMVRRGKPRLSR